MKNFPSTDLIMVAEGRLSVKWYNIEEPESWLEAGVEETLYIRDFLDEQRLQKLYP